MLVFINYSSQHVFVEDRGGRGKKEERKEERKKERKKERFSWPVRGDVSSLSATKTRFQSYCSEFEGRAI